MVRRRRHRTAAFGAPVGDLPLPAGPGGELSATATASATTLEPAERVSPGMRRVHWVLAGAVVGSVVAIAWRTGAYRLPYSDDWAYLRMQDVLDRTGRIVGVGWNDVSLVGQLEVVRAVDAILDDTVLASRLVTIGSGIACAALTWVLTRRTRRRDLSALAVLSLVVFPGFASLLVTSMTDLPSTAAMLGCLAAGMAAPVGTGSERRVRTSWLVVAVMAGVLAITIRQVGAAAPVAVVATLLVMPQTRRSRRTVLAVGAVGAAVSLAFLAWRSGLDVSAPTATFTPVRSSVVVVRAGMLLSLGLVPLVLATGGVRQWRTARDELSARRGWSSALLAAPVLAFFVALAAGWNQPVVPTTLVREGPIGSQSLGSLSDGTSTLVWRGVALLAALAAAAALAMLLGRVVPSLASRSGREIAERAVANPALTMPAAFALLSFALVAASEYLQHVIQLDRYLLATLVASMVLALGPSDGAASGPRRPDDRVEAPASRRGVVAATVIAGVLAVVAVWSVADWDAYQVARFDGAAVALANGAPAGTVDAGFEYIGASGAKAAPKIIEATDSYLLAFPEFHRCALVTTDTTAPPGMREVGVVTYRVLFGLARRTMHVYVQPSC